MADRVQKKPKGLPKRYSSAGRKERRRRYFLRHSKAYTGR